NEEGTLIGVGLAAVVIFLSTTRLRAFPWLYLSQMPVPQAGRPPDRLPAQTATLGPRLRRVQLKFFICQIVLLLPLGARQALGETDYFLVFSMVMEPSICTSYTKCAVPTISGRRGSCVST